MPAKLNGIALAAVGAGSILIWSGIKGWSVLGTIGDVISGKAPNQEAVYSLSDPGAPTNDALVGGATGSAISDDALKYQGHAYNYGGAPGTNGESPWDCSSFCNWVVGHDMHMAIPGYSPGQYNGSVHGPPTGSWGIWPGLRRLSRSDVQAGDLIVWAGHMGIAISNSHMVSALDPKHGTEVTPIDGYGNGPILKYGRL
jgi:cell wall-associated NlpC family hydrolase